MDLDFDGCMGRLQNVCHNYPVYCFLRGAVCKKPQTYRWLYFGLWMWLLKLSLVVVVVDDDDDEDDLVFSALVFVCVSLCLLSCTCLFVHLSLSYPAYFCGGSICQKSHELTRRLLSNEVTSSSPRHPYRCISVGFQQGWDDHSTSTRMKRATVVNLRLLEMPGNVDVPSLDQRWEISSFTHASEQVQTVLCTVAGVTVVTEKRKYMLCVYGIRQARKLAIHASISPNHMDSNSDFGGFCLQQ